MAIDDKTRAMMLSLAEQLADDKPGSLYRDAIDALDSIDTNPFPFIPDGTRAFLFGVAATVIACVLVFT